jgi:hypothetical protein
MTIAKIWDGSSWFAPSGFNRPKIWNGSTWVFAQPRIWDGSNWGDNLTTGSTVTIFFGGKGPQNFAYNETYSFCDYDFSSLIKNSLILLSCK